METKLQAVEEAFQRDQEAYKRAYDAEQSLRDEWQNHQWCNPTRNREDVRYARELADSLTQEASTLVAYANGLEALLHEQKKSLPGETQYIIVSLRREGKDQSMRFEGPYAKEVADRLVLPGQLVSELDPPRHKSSQPGEMKR